MVNQRVMGQCTLFVLSSQYVLFWWSGTGLFRPSVAQFELGSGLI
jgi:hypothetical protein